MAKTSNKTSFPKTCEYFRLYFANFFAKFCIFFAKMYEAKIAKTFSREKKINFTKTISVATTINCAKKLVEFSALRVQHLKFYYFILKISLPLLK